MRFRKIVLKLAIMGGLWAVGPTLAVLAHSLIAPDRVGVFEETELDLPLLARQGTNEAVQPEIGNAHVFETGPVMGFGTPEPRRWFGLGVRSGTPRPIVVLLHPSGQDGQSVLALWQGVAKKRDIVLVAPEARGDTWSMISDGPMFLAALLKEVGVNYPMASDWIFLVGYGEGAAHAMRIANLGGGPFGAVAAVSGQSPRFRMLPALTPVPVLGFVGDHDGDDAVPNMRAALDRLAQAGHPATLTRISGGTAMDAGASQGLADHIWTRLSDRAPASLRAQAPADTSSDPTGVVVRRGTDTGSGAKWIRVGPGD
ncbi:hypothetical protein MWU54_13290 [Marivita sp. S6314]|uniref:alpha/beta hydrolase n=1 Tax=Marivita sp. S6314 TaxID=2926406 RepID=UPI001FF2E986|nr:hypothetical protein [Marivita sp. S6314]MCK0151008.1 hypothetical protein [Marivita sp. S6314]